VHESEGGSKRGLERVRVRWSRVWSLEIKTTGSAGVGRITIFPVVGRDARG
jgi:hypothetical protein